MNLLKNDGLISGLQDINNSIKLGFMIRKALTYFTILAITALPVQLISADVENISMQMSMEHQALSSKECLHDMKRQIESETKNTCCDNQNQSCQGCNDISHATSVFVSPSQNFTKNFITKTSKISISHLLLDGVPQKNLLRPPRNFI